MKLHFYIAASLADRAAAEQLAGALVMRGHAITYLWWEQRDLRTIFADASPLQAAAALAARSNAEIESIRRADLLVAILPGGVGTHVEIGVALGMGKPVILLDAPDLIGRPTDGGRAYPCAFHFADGVIRVRCLRGTLADPTAEARFCAARCLDQLPAEGELWRHPKRGTTYAILSVGRLQAHDAGTLHDGDVMVTYEATVAPTDGYARVSSRVLGEFMARFERVST